MQLFATGSGSSQHTGIATGVGAVTTSRVASITADTLGIEDVYAVDTALPARYRANSGWLMHRYVANSIRQFDTAGGAGMWARIGEGQPDQLIGKPVFEAESMDGAITAAADNDLIVYGDRDAFVVADRLGMVIEPINHVFQQETAGTGIGMPTGQRGFYAYARSGSNVVNAGGLRLLRV
jgi:HK97 family phage major capsid protein